MSRAHLIPAKVLALAVLAFVIGAPSALADDNVTTTTPMPTGSTYDSSTGAGYTTEPGEHTQCPPGTFGAKSGWTRFDAAVSGTLTVTVTTSYDAIVHGYTLPSATAPTVDTLQDQGCNDDSSAPGGGTETLAVAVASGQSVYVQTLGVCPVSCVVFAGSGATTVQFTFVASDADSDGVPDTIDACPATAGAGPDGCPVTPPPPPPVAAPPPPPPPVAVTPPVDTDKDGVANITDACDRVPGDKANGCPSTLVGKIRGRWKVNRLLTKMLSLVVRAPLGSRIDVRCAGTRGACPFKHRIITKTTRRSTGLTRQFGRRRIFPSGMSIVVRVTHARQTGIYQRLVTRRGLKLPKVVNACIASDGQLRTCG